jgi:hemolysin III
MQNPVRGLLHGSAAVASVFGGVLLWMRCSGDVSRQLALLVFAASLVTLYTASSLYHSVPWRRVWKARMQRVDHSMIYVLIAGSYTPIAFVVLDGWPRVLALVASWVIAAIGIVQKVFWPGVRHGFSIALQTLQGWLAVPLLWPLAQRLPEPALYLILLGGFFYTVGMVLFVTKRPRLWPRLFSYHEVFHVFVIAGSTAHYLMAFWYVAGFAGGA